MNRFLTFWFAICILVCAGTNSAQAQGNGAQEGIVLIIANQSYDGKFWTKLRNPINDARIIKEKFEQIGFKVHTPAVNLTRNLLDIRIKEFREQANNLPKRSVAIVYYTGHGIQVDGTNYLIPIGSPPVLAADSLSQSERAEWLRKNFLAINELLRAFGNNRNDDNEGANILILDACRTNPWEQRSKGVTLPKGLADIPIVANTLIAFSAAPGTIADDGTTDNSPYAKALYEQLSRTNIPLELLFSEISFRVIQSTRASGIQRPDYRFALSRSFCLKSCNGHNPASDIIAGKLDHSFEKPQSTEISCELCIGMTTVQLASRKLMIANFPVSLDVWRMCAKELSCKDVGKSDDSGQLPVTNISWDEVMKFLNWASARHNKNYRLISKDEWRELINGLPNLIRNKYKSIRPIKSDTADFGKDYLGQIIEWTSSCSNSCAEHVTVGATYKNPTQSLLAEFPLPNDVSGEELGFRVVQDIDQ